MVITQTCEICQQYLLIWLKKRNPNYVVMTDDYHASLPRCHLFIMGAGWSLFQQAVRKVLWPCARHTPSFSLQIIHVFGLWEEAFYLEKPFKGPGPSANKDPEGNTAPNLDTITPNLWVCVYLSSFKLNILPGDWYHHTQRARHTSLLIWTWFQRYEYRLTKPLAMALVSDVPLAFRAGALAVCPPLSQAE